MKYLQDFFCEAESMGCPLGVPGDHPQHALRRASIHLHRLPGHILKLVW